MNIRKLLAAAVVAVAALAGGTVAAQPAGAGTAPVMYAAHNDSWHGYVRPGTVYFGNGGSPYLTGLTWHSWTGTSAWGTGGLWTVRPGCTPLYLCPYHSQWVGVYLSVIRWHGGQRYYARMAAEFYHAGRWQWDVGWFPHYNCTGCVAVWGFPPVWPYL